MARQPKKPNTVDTVETGKPVASPEKQYLRETVTALLKSLKPSELAEVKKLSWGSLFACEGTLIPLTTLLESVLTSGLQSDVDIRQLKNILFGDTGLSKTGKLLHNIQVSYLNNELKIVGGRNRALTLYAVASALGLSELDKLMIPCQVLSYANEKDLYTAIVAANQSRRMANQEVISTLVSTKVKDLTIGSLCSAVLTEREYKSLASMLLRKMLSEKYGDSLTIIDYSLGLKTARDSKFFLEYISKLLPKLSAISDKKTKLIDASKLTSVLNNLMAEISELDAVKADKFLSYLNQNDRELPSGLTLPLCCYPIALFRVAGLEEIARNLTKTGLTGLDGLAPLAMSLITSQYGEKGLLKNSEATISTASLEAVSTIDISVFDF